MKRGIKLKMKKKYESTRNIKFNIQTYDIKFKCYNEY